jgi:Prokaryotic E2 family A/Prokaryotic homologs of the JAB domain
MRPGQVLTMNGNNVPLNGRVIGVGELQIPKAQELVQTLRAGTVDWAHFVECRRVEVADQIAGMTQDGMEIIVLDVEVELPQHKAHDIRHLERIAVGLSQEDEGYPEVLALRENFPLVPHLNLRSFEIPRSFCLYYEPYSEIKLRWTAPAFIERIRTWLAKTATGSLHAEDQQLEPLLIGSPARLILPSDLFAGGDQDIPERLEISRVNSGCERFCLIGERPGINGQPAGKNSAPQFVATIIVGAPQTHGIIRRQPLNLRELHEFLGSAEVDLLSILRARLRGWQFDEAVLNASLVIILILPKARKAGGPEEAADIWAFICTRTIAEERKNGIPTKSGQVGFATVAAVGEQIGLWKKNSDKIATLIPIDAEKEGRQVEVALLDPSFALSREGAARFNGLSNRDVRKITAIGLGSLGSQVFLNLLRSAYGEWNLIDKDLLLPHNLARHGLYGAVVGAPKVEPLAFYANSTIDGPPIASAIVADVLEPGDAAEQVTKSLAESDVILDLSASVAVARHLSHEVNAHGRRASLFLNPSGTDLVMLVEDAERKIQLAALEMQYYRLLTDEIDLHTHLRRGGERIRYAHSCRDLSTTISQEHVAMHAAIGSRMLRHALESDRATIAIWHADENGGVLNYRSSPIPTMFERRGAWAIYFDTGLLKRVKRIRYKRLPNETGGILIGTFDMQRSIVYVVDALPAPSDSQERPQGFIRGFHGLTESVEKIEKITGGQLSYVGEWHSHPPGHDATPSENYDRKLFEWLTEKMARDGLPALMLIAGDRQTHTWHLNTLSEKQ